MAKPNYAFAKRQRDLAKQQKKDEKRKRKAEAAAVPPAEGTGDGSAEVPANPSSPVADKSQS